ncbi:PREDICTED: G patch domain-containing protein 11-like [Nicrophorus vespilloides]|uniref:G patch domain-containing protein 11 n=1 Tax=Nicrophorus vespilloides TaxID=110193 RepID=A0ABM1M7Q6_NICVS|nr:PREDICTED: G patch domain-containing protein 11-like [Nicrophorus vespilloides]
MSSDEDDYMSDKFLASLSSNVGLPKRKQDQRQHEMFKKKIKSVLPKKAETEAAAREAGLKNAISEDNKGFKMLQKMGYKPGSGLGIRNTGIIEPINVIVKTNNSGVGAKSSIRIKKEKNRQIKEEEAKKLEAEFRKAIQEKSRLKSLFTFFRKAQTACEHLDTNEDLMEPIVDFYWPIKIKEKEDDEEQVKDEADSTDEEEEENVITEENLLKLTEYLRSRHFYCIYCASKADDLEDLDSFCPGNSVEGHNTDY